MFPIGWILMLRQPEVYEELTRIYNIPRVRLQDIPALMIAEILEDELTKEQRELARLMREKPGWDKKGE